MGRVTTPSLSHPTVRGSTSSLESGTSMLESRSGQAWLGAPSPTAGSPGRGASTFAKTAAAALRKTDSWESHLRLPTSRGRLSPGETPRTVGSTCALGRCSGKSEPTLSPPRFVFSFSAVSSTFPNLRCGYFSISPLLAGFGPRLSFSRPDSPGDAPVSWQPANEPLIFADSGSWDRANTSHELIAYASVVVDPTESDQLWFYYTYLEPGAGFTQRYFVRRRVDTVTSSQPFLAGAVVLTMLKGPARAGRAGDWWATTAVNVPNSNYTRVGAVGGAVFVSGGPNRTRLVDCYISGWDDHMVGYETECTVGSLGPTVGIRTLGFVLTEAGAADAQRAGVTTTQIFRCFDNATKNHAISSDPHCQGYGGSEFPLGYVLSLE